MQTRSGGRMGRTGARRRRGVIAGAVALVAVAAWGCAGPQEASPGDDPREAAVLEAVQDLFDAMEARDGDAVARVLHPEGQFYRVPIPFDGLPSPMPHSAFVASVGGEGPGLLERMRDPEVLIHERLAVAWTPYDFHADGEFSHCGVNAFTLVEEEDGWRITGITYTVEPDPDSCPDGLGPGTLDGS